MPEAPNRESLAARRLMAFELRKGGASYAAIGTALKISHTMARRDVLAVLDELTRDTAETIERSRRLHLARLDDLLLAVMPAAKKGDHRAIHSALEIMGRQAKLQGLDAPIRVDVTQELERIAGEEGLDPDELIAIFERIIANPN